MSLAEPENQAEIIDRLLMPRAAFAKFGDSHVLVHPDYVPLRLTRHVAVIPPGEYEDGEWWEAKVLKFTDPSK